MTDDRLVITDGDADTDAVREYEATRRQLVRRGLRLGGLTVAASGVPTLLRVGRAFAQGGGDAKILEAAIRLEQTAVIVYDQAAQSGKLQPAVRDAARLFRDQEREHASSLSAALQALGGKPPAEPDFTHLRQPNRPGGQKEILEFAVAIEEMAVAAYYEAQQKLRDAKLLSTGAAIMANEGQHLVVLRQTLKRNPVPGAFEPGKALQ
jgi:rubrerythrin